jgi:hypothetical protein
MSGVLIITADDRAQIKMAILAARAKTIPWSVMQEIAIDDREKPTPTLRLDERSNPDRIREIRETYPVESLQLGTYEIALSFEEQPAGVFRHLSVASARPGMVPNEHVMAMLAQEFGFSAWPPVRPYRVWVEEFAAGRSAINLVELDKARGVEA